MTDRFPNCLAFTWLPHWDGQPFHVTPGDAGGGTAWGVTIGIFAAWRAAHGVHTTTPADLQAATKAQLSELIRAWFWAPVQAPRLPPGVDLAVFDFAFTSGTGNAARLLQHAVGATVDGVIGEKTLGAANTTDRLALVTRISALKLAFYQAIPEPGGWAEFGAGWSRRNTACLQAARTMAAATDPAPAILSQPDIVHMQALASARAA